MNNFPLKYTFAQNQFRIWPSSEDAKMSFLNGNPLTLEPISDTTIRVHSRKSISYAIENPPLPKSCFKAGNDTSSEKISLSTDSLCVLVDSKLHITFLDPSGQLLCTDYEGELFSPEDLSQEELDQMAQEGHVIHSGKDSCKFQIAKKMFGDECFYGLGDKTGFLNKRGYDFMMWNSDNPDPHVENPTFKALYKSIPFFITLRKNCVYGIFFDNHFKTYFDMGFSDPNYFSFGAADGELDYYFIYGKTISSVLEQYTELTGRSPLPQMWTLGYHQSRWSYSSAEEVLELAKNFRKYNIPCDAIHLDIDYMDNFKVFTTNPKTFPDLKGLSEQLREMGIKLVTIIDPGTKAEEGYELYDEGMQNGYFAKDSEGQVYHNAVWPGDSVFPDFTSTKVRKWWGTQTKKLLSKNIRGIWNDMNEPASFNGPLPDDVVFPGDQEAHLHREIHNVYGHLMAKATYEGLKVNDGKRPFVITRACYSGSQKYTTAWTGDNQSIWTHLQMSIPQLLNLGMSGMPFVGTDIGGFGSNTTPELLSRWVEAHCFSPLFRNHCGKYCRHQEPWQFDEETLRINQKYIKLHYKFLPYLYDLCYEESKTGIPMLRPLVMHFQNDDAVKECNSEYLVGSSILVAPILEQGARARSIYLPDAEWVDYWTGNIYSGKQYIVQEVPLDHCPIFIKAGSLLPVWEDMLSIPENGVHTLILEYYAGNTQETPIYTHYQDNGTDFSYENGEYNLYQFSINKQALTTKMLHDGYSHYDKILFKQR